MLVLFIIGTKVASASPSRTAEYMALFRALETVRPRNQRLFADPFAVKFLPLRLRLVAKLARLSPLHAAIVRLIDLLWPGARSSAVARTRLIDDSLREALKGGIDQVVLLGAGFDSRAYRLPELAGKRVFEIDQPRTLSEKSRRVSSLTDVAAGHVTFVSLDFKRASLSEALRAAGLDVSQPAFFIWEGVTNYLTQNAVDAVLAFIGSTAPGSRLLFTYVHRDVIERPTAFEGTRRLRRSLRRFGETWSFGLAPGDLPCVLDRFGLSLIEDIGSSEYRARYLGERGPHLKGYEFYRAALVAVGEPCPR